MGKRKDEEGGIDFIWCTTTFHFWAAWYSYRSREYFRWCTT